jgi:hypothetical protein
LGRVLNAQPLESPWVLHRSFHLATGCPCGWFLVRQRWEGLKTDLEHICTLLGAFYLKKKMVSCVCVLIMEDWI